MQLKLRKGKAREFSRTGIEISVNAGSSRALIRVDATFRVVTAEEQEQIKAGEVSDTEIAQRYIVRCDAPKVELEDESGEPMTDLDERSAFLLEQPEIALGLVRCYGREINGEGKGVRRKN